MFYGRQNIQIHVNLPDMLLEQKQCTSHKLVANCNRELSEKHYQSDQYLDHIYSSPDISVPDEVVKSQQ